MTSQHRWRLSLAGLAVVVIAVVVMQLVVHIHTVGTVGR